MAQQDTIWDKGTDKEKLQNIIKILSNEPLQSEKAIFLSVKAIEFSKMLKDKKSLSLGFKFLGNAYFSKSDFEHAIKYYLLAINYAQAINEREIISDCYYNLSFSYRSMGNYAEALKCSKTAFELDYARNDSAAMAESYNSMGIIYENMGNYEKALGNYLKSLEISESINDLTGIAQRYNNIGIVFFNLSNFEKAREYFVKSIDLLEKLGNMQEKCKPMISMGDLYERTEKYDSSLILFNQVLELSEKFDDKYLNANILSRLGDIYLVKNDYIKAIAYYQQCQEIKLSIKDYDGVVRAHISQAGIYIRLNNFQQALVHLKNAQDIMQKVNSKKLLSEIYQWYYQIYRRQNNIVYALKYYEMYTSMKDSAFSENNSKKIYELQTIYETEKKEKENEILRQSNQIKVLELDRSRTVKNFFLIIAILILILTSILYARFRTKLKTNRILKEKNTLLESQKQQISNQKSEIEHKNQLITDSIEYASMIQESMLPDIKILKNAFPESFILFYPRDIVSGDFYWIYEMNEKMVIVVADCTGHGVPAAFMSMIGIEILSGIFEEKKVQGTDCALNLLGEGIRKALHQEKTGNEDGMEITICIIDKLSSTIEFSSARRPILYIENNELHEIKGDMLSIGGPPVPGFSYSKHTISYHSPITIYLFSDGYHHQFGGLHNAKISYNQFRKLLHENSIKPMDEQKAFLDNFLLKWKGNGAQIDDILIVGLRVDWNKLNQ